MLATAALTQAQTASLEVNGMVYGGAAFTIQGEARLFGAFEGVTFTYGGGYVINYRLNGNRTLRFENNKRNGKLLLVIRDNWTDFDPVTGECLNPDGNGGCILNPRNVISFEMEKENVIFQTVNGPTTFGGNENVNHAQITHLTRTMRVWQYDGTGWRWGRNDSVEVGFVMRLPLGIITAENVNLD